MEAYSLQETLSVCGESFDLYAKTGQYKGRHHQNGYEFFGERGDAGESFQVDRVNLSADIELAIDDRVSIVKLGEDGPFFLAFNHRNSKYKYYPEAIRDLAWGPLKRGWFATILNGSRLNKAANTFTTTRTFSRVLKTLKTL